jgi:hypothetical protein
LPLKVYASKEAIYKDFKIAVKFGLEHPVHCRDYEQIFGEFTCDQRTKLTEFSRTIANYKTKYPISTGFFVDVPVKGDTGEEIGARFILLEHETGWEFFIPLASALAAWLGPKVAEKVAGAALDAAIKQLIVFMKEEWPKLIRGGTRIDHVEIRTENKGVMRLPFAEFDVSQIKCLMGTFPVIAHLSECNTKCFGGMLVEPRASTAAPQSRD